MRASKRNYKKEYKKFQSSPEMIKYRTRLNKENRDRGTYGNGDGMDVSHKAKGTVLEKESVNRGRLGEGGRKKGPRAIKRAKRGMRLKKTPRYSLGGVTQNEQALMNQVMNQQVDSNNDPEKEKERPVDRLKRFFNRKKQDELQPMKPIKSKTVEEMPDSYPRGERELREQNLQLAAADMTKYLIDPELAPPSVQQLMLDEGLTREEAEKEYERLSTQAFDRRGAFRKEGDPIAREYIEGDLFPSVGYMDADSTRTAWSAATVSKLAEAFDPTFEGSVNHGDYIRRAFRNESGIGYTAEPIEDATQFRVGDILFEGRLDSAGNPAGPQTYREFERDARGKGEFADRQYGSHTDIIVDVVRRGDDVYYVVQGGNIGKPGEGKLRLREYTAAQLAAKYEGRLTQ
jgi:hypothetical protein